MRRRLARERTVVFMRGCLAAFLKVAAGLGLLIGPVAAVVASGERGEVEPPLPVTRLEGTITTVSEFLAYGPWEIPSRSSWHKAPAALPVAADGRMAWAELEKPPFNAAPRPTGDAVNGVDYTPFAGVANDWKGNHVMLLACKVVADAGECVVLDISNDDNADVYINGNYLGVVANWVLPRGGQFHAFPAMLEEGGNILVFKHVTANRASRFKVNIVRDGSRDFDAAWGPKEGLLARLVYSPERPREKPSVQWPPLLENMAVEAEVTDLFSGEVFQTQILRNGDALRLGGLENGGANGNAADDADNIKGAYTIRYKNAGGRGEEQFVVGDPRKLKEQMENRLNRLHASPKTQINAKALLRRLEILCEDGNYKLNDRKWQEKTAYTLCSLATLLGALERGVLDPARDAPGLHIRGFASSLDISTQHYRLYIPSSYQRGRKLPLLVIMPTSISASQRPFLESAFIANHRDAVRMGRVAERHGFGVLWPGYRNAPAGLPCEDAHLDEALKAVQEDYGLDLQRIHLYGACSGGIFAGNAVARWPGRFASIIYNKAIFTRVAESMQRLPKEEQEWARLMDPSEAVLQNAAISVFITNTEETQAGHGEIELSLAFMERAGKAGKGVTADMMPPRICDTAWDRVFQWAASCKQENPNEEISERHRLHGYSGPAAEVFATPRIIVQGTSGSMIESARIEKFIQCFQQYYAECFYGATCRVVKDTELSDADIVGHSLIVVGNPKANKMWEKLQEKSVIKTDDAGVSLGKHRWNGKLAYHLVLKNGSSPFIMGKV